MSKGERHLYEFGDFRLDASERLLSRRGVTVPLTPKAIDLLVALVAQPGRLLDKDILLRTVWPDSFVEENNLADNIFKLRRVLGDGGERDEVHRNRSEARLPFRRRRARRRAVDGGGARAGAADRCGAATPGGATRGAGPAARHQHSETHKRSLVSGRPTILLVLALGVGYGRRETPQPPRMLKAELLPPPDHASFGDIAVSPDGQWLAFTAATGSRVQLWLRSLTGDEAHPLENTDGASHPFWSPDSRVVASFAAGRLKKVELGDGLPVTLCQASWVRGGTWSREGVILFTVLGVPQNSRGSRPRAACLKWCCALVREKPICTSHSSCPMAAVFYLAINSGKKDAGGIYVGSLDGTLRQRVLEHDSNAVFVAGDASNRQRGYLLFGREGGLMAQAFDAEALRTIGEAAPIAARLGTVLGANLSYRRRNFTASDNGLPDL